MLVTLTVGIKLNVKADVVYTLCPNDYNASIRFVPALTVGVYGSCRASIILASATLGLSGSVTDSLEPSVYIQGDMCKVGFKAENNFQGITADLSYKYRVFFWSSSWHTIWSHTWGKRRDTLYNTSFSGLPDES